MKNVTGIKGIRFNPRFGGEINMCAYTYALHLPASAVRFNPVHISEIRRHLGGRRNVFNMITFPFIANVCY